MRIAKKLLQLAVNSKKAAQFLRTCSNEQKSYALQMISIFLEKEKEKILSANIIDLEEGRKKGLSSALLDRLSLQGRLQGIIDDLRKIEDFEDPIGQILESRKLKNGLRIEKKRVPIGVIGVIYEARPNVTIDIAALCLKAGNCALLKGGKEASATNQALMECIQKGLIQAKLPEAAVQSIFFTGSSQIKQLLRMDQYIDLIIPRGGEGLHRFCKENSTIPVITGGIGICHLFVDETADVEKSIEVIINAKTQRPTVCNAVDTILVHSRIAERFLPRILHSLQENGVTLRLDSIAFSILKDNEHASMPTHCIEAQEKDWRTEWLSLTLGIKIVISLKEALEHIHTYSSGHSDGILTQCKENATFFMNEVDSSAVFINASTRFNDGGQLGLGSEVAISTQKLHARGPMGLNELTTYKWVIEGDYHVRQS